MDRSEEHEGSVGKHASACRPRYQLTQAARHCLLELANVLRRNKFPARRGLRRSRNVTAAEYAGFRRAAEAAHCGRCNKTPQEVKRCRQARKNSSMRADGLPGSEAAQAAGAAIETFDGERAKLQDATPRPAIAARSEHQAIEVEAARGLFDRAWRCRPRLPGTPSHSINRTSKLSVSTEFWRLAASAHKARGAQSDSRWPIRRCTTQERAGQTRETST